jgi:hypothetical protein
VADGEGAVSDEWLHVEITGGRLIKKEKEAIMYLQELEEVRENEK